MRETALRTLAGTHSASAQARAVLGGLERLALYTDVLDEPIGQGYAALLRHAAAGESAAQFTAAAAQLSGLLAAYAELQAAPQPHGDAWRCDAWQGFLLTRILEAENAFSRKAAFTGPDGLSPALTALAEQDLAILQGAFALAASALRSFAHAQGWDEALPYLAWEDFQPLGPSANHAPVAETHRALAAMTDWRQAVPLLAAHYHRHGTGDFARYRAFRWEHSTQGGRLRGVPHPDPIRLEELIGDDRQRGLLRQNTEHLLAGYRANNVLLCGDRGTGKSSSIKALLHRYVNCGLRLIEVAKDDLGDFARIVEILRARPQSFVVFVDDLSFEPHETDYKALKAILEGSVAAQPRNVVIYATSNRSHLVRENFSDRAGILDGEVHPKETLQETFSLSDRFGIRIAFTAPTQAQYLAIVAALAAQRNLSLGEAALRARAVTWAQQQNGFSGRTARQFVDFLEGELGSGEAR